MIYVTFAPKIWCYYRACRCHSFWSEVFQGFEPVLHVRFIQTGTDDNLFPNCPKAIKLYLGNTKSLCVFLPSAINIFFLSFKSETILFNKKFILKKEKVDAMGQYCSHVWNQWQRVTRVYHASSRSRPDLKINKVGSYTK